MGKPLLTKEEKQTYLKNLKNRIKYNEKVGYKINTKMREKIFSGKVKPSELIKYTEKFERYVKYYLYNPETGEQYPVSKGEARKGKSKYYPQAEKIIIQKATKLFIRTINELLQASNREILPSTSRRWDIEREHMLKKLSYRLEQISHNKYDKETAEKLEDNSGAIFDVLEKLYFSSSQRDNIYSVKSAYENVMNLLASILKIEIEGAIPVADEADFGE